MPETINNNEDFKDQKEYLLQLLERESVRMADHYYKHIKELILSEEIDEAHRNLMDFRRFYKAHLTDNTLQDNEDEQTQSINLKYKKRRTNSESDYSTHLKKIEERNSILSLKLEELSRDSEVKNRQLEKLVVKTKILQDENNELRSQVQQQRIDEKIPTYVNNVKSDLGSDDKHFIIMSIIWSIFGGIFGVLAVTSAFYTLYINIDLKDLGNLQLMYIFTRGLIGIAILSWLSYICLSNSKKYTHESIRRKDRRHALMFGQVFLQIYGSTATKDDAIVVFKDWNMSGDSAFSDQTEQPPGLMSLWNAAKDKVKATGDVKESA
ncbi:hypothetical protein THOKLE011_37110 [Klebsiella michiganensis]|uniref:hypothetical protein n=2 Tax=Klebsiella michiganensis TaxID=1134687 RepID=UPI0018A60B56|nr:hypothetical protein [Klebsiella michiganensis]BBW77421.1 hypothetical protein THOKLE011_37110 [Klebsiella michiganensis]HBK4726286.1 hypothetical protein [Klebsiella michiganensis]